MGKECKREHETCWWLAHDMTPGHTHQSVKLFGTMLLDVYRHSPISCIESWPKPFSKHARIFVAAPCY